MLLATLLALHAPITAAQEYPDLPRRHAQRATACLNERLTDGRSSYVPAWLEDHGITTQVVDLPERDGFEGRLPAITVTYENRHWRIVLPTSADDSPALGWYALYRREVGPERIERLDPEGVAWLRGWRLNRHTVVEAYAGGHQPPVLVLLASVCLDQSIENIWDP